MFSRLTSFLLTPLVGPFSLMVGLDKQSGHPVLRPESLKPYHAFEANSGNCIDHFCQTGSRTGKEGQPTVKQGAPYNHPGSYRGSLLPGEHCLIPLGRSSANLCWTERDPSGRRDGRDADAFRDWAAQVLRKLETLRQQALWPALEEMADKALRSAVADPLRAGVRPPNSSISYTVLFARYRAAAILQAAHEAWRRGEFEQAVSAYERLLATTNWVWEGKAAGGDGATAAGTGTTACAEWGREISLAGLRLALWGALRGGPEGAQLLAALPRRVVAVMARLERPGPTLAGEEISAPVVATAVLIDRFVREAGIAVDYRAELPPSMQEAEFPPAWSHAAQMTFGLQQWLLFSALLVRDTPPHLVLNSSLGRWLRAQVYRAAAPWLAAAMVLVGAASWLGDVLLW